MLPKTFKAMIVRQPVPGRFVRTIGQKTLSSLPQGEILVAVAYSSLNYKDALGATGHKGVAKDYPHTPGIDAAGTIVESTVSQFSPGDNVIVTSYGLGVDISGGFAQYIRVPAQWVVPLPGGLTLRQSMVLGTAGFTAALSLYELLEAGLRPESGEILVTGASGGVGSLAVALLAKLGFKVVGLTGKIDQAQFLKTLGAHRLIGRDALESPLEKPLERGQWAGVIDTVGGPILASALKSIQYRGVATCCGLTASYKLRSTVYPFILRGIRLIGIDSAQCPMALRGQIWQNLADAWKLAKLDSLAKEYRLEELGDCIDKMLAAQLSGRVIINPNL